MIRLDQLVSGIEGAEMSPLFFNLKNMAKKKWHDFESDEEYFYYQWLLELQDLGYINSIVIQPHYNLMDPFTIKSPKEKTVTLIKKWDYSPDFLIKWNKKAIKDGLVIVLGDLTKYESFEIATRGKHIIQYSIGEEWFSVIDVKSDFSASTNASDIRFPLNQKAMFMKYGIYVQKIMPLSKKRNGLFLNTFTPKSFLKTKTGKDKKVNWKINTVGGYVQTLESSNS